MARRKRDLTRALRTDILQVSGLPALAQLIQAKGRGRDTILAHITPNEARILKERGGSGTRNPDTGLLEFEETFIDTSMPYEAQTYSAPYVPPTNYQVSQAPLPQVGFENPVQAPASSGYEYQPDVFTPSYSVGAPAAAVPTVAPTGTSASGQPGEFLTPSYGVGAPATQEEPDYLTRLGRRAGKALEDPAVLARLGLGLGGGVLGALQSRRMGQQAKQFRAEEEAIAEPYRRQGREMVAAAQRGELTPAAQQAMQAARAQAAQATERSGGVGIQQQSQRLAELQQRLLQQQSDYGIKLSNIGDQIALGAIRSGLQASQAVNQANEKFFGMLGSIIGALPPEQQKATA